MVTTRSAEQVVSFQGKLGPGVFTLEELDELLEAIRRAKAQLGKRETHRRSAPHHCTSQPLD